MLGKDQQLSVITTCKLLSKPEAFTIEGLATGSWMQPSSQTSEYRCA